MILIDSIGHMVSDISVEELHKFASDLGMRRRWFQTPGYGLNHAHYDLTTSRMKAKAKRFGAIEVHPMDLVKRAWWNEK